LKKQNRTAFLQKYYERNISTIVNKKNPEKTEGTIRN